jgi:cytoskeleton protein RodZ
MNEAISEGCGQRLSEARLALTWSVETVAGHLKLSVSQIRAMEAEDWACFPSKVALRGFVRAYAQDLGLATGACFSDAPSNVEQIETMSAPSAEIALAGSRTRLWLILIPAVLAAFFVGVMGLYAWLSQGSDAPLTDPVVLPVPVSVPVTQVTPITPIAPIAPVEPTVPVPVQSVPVTAAVSTPAQVGATQGLTFTATSNAWVEIVDASNQRVQRMVRIGESVHIKGQPPYRLIVGNAAQVHLEYNGRVVDLHPYIGDKVARLTLE